MIERIINNSQKIKTGEEWAILFNLKVLSFEGWDIRGWGFEMTRISMGHFFLCIRRGRWEEIVPIFTSLDELKENILSFLPFAALGEDNEGQILIYTNYWQTESGELKEEQSSLAH